MNNVKCIVLIGLVAFAMVAILPFSGVATPSNTQAEVTPVITEHARATQASYVIASAHNYANSYTYTWPAKTVTGATQIRVHFTRIELEATYDKIYILNSAGTTVQTFGATSTTSTYASGVWSNWVTGTTFSVKLVTDSSVTKWGFATDLVEYETGTTPPPPTSVLTNGVASSGSLTATGNSQTWTIAVNSGCTQMVTSVSHASGADFDTYGKAGSAPTTSSYTWRGYTSSNPEVVTYANPAAGTWYILVYSYSGSGTYTITCTLTYASADTTAPTVSITSPANGATVSGSVTVTVSASDNVGVTSTGISIDGGAYTTSLTWATTSVADGSHTIQARALDAAGNIGYSSTITVTVKNTVTPPPTSVLTSGVPATGSLAAVGATYTYTMVVDANCQSMAAVLTCGSADFDLYGKLGSAPTTASYGWRGYTSGGEEVTTANPGAGTWYIMVNSYSGTGAYTLTVTLTYGTTPPPPTGNKYAVLVGISNYKSINDLSFCDEDVTDFFNYLTTVCGYSAANIRILGDGSSSYPQTAWGKATEANYKACLTWLAGLAADEITFMTSGHGSGDGAGESYLCAWDCSSGESGEDGSFYDHEISAILQNALATKIFIFIDHCYSGGLGPEIMAMGNKAKVWMTTTCTANGYGYDEPTSSNGAWTNQFIHVTLQQHFGSSAATTMEAAFTYAASGYSHTGGDAPMQFDGNTASTFTI
jgi:hypothetical protein